MTLGFKGLNKFRSRRFSVAVDMKVLRHVLSNFHWIGLLARFNQTLEIEISFFVNLKSVCLRLCMAVAWTV